MKSRKTIKVKNCIYRKTKHITCAISRPSPPSWNFESTMHRNPGIAILAPPGISQYYFPWRWDSISMFCTAKSNFLDPLPHFIMLLRIFNFYQSRCACALMYEVKLMSKNPSSATAISLSNRKERLYRLYRLVRVCRLYRAYRCTECTGCTERRKWICKM